MTLLRTTLGLIAGTLLIVSSAMHSLLGWKAASEELRKTTVSADMTQALALGWHFGGVAMLTMGVIIVLTFSGKRRGEPGLLRNTLLIGLAYLVYGLCALVTTHFDPFFLLFIVPGLMLIIASWPRTVTP